MPDPVHSMTIKFLKQQSGVCHEPKNQCNQHAPWNKGKLIGQKLPLKLKEIWAIRIRLQMSQNIREQALFNLAIDSKQATIWIWI